MRAIPPGIYEHYKGKRYRVIGIAKHSETLEEFVVYETIDDAPLGKLWIRPKKMFSEDVEFNGHVMPRFKLITPNSE